MGVMRVSGDDVPLADRDGLVQRAHLFASRRCDPLEEAIPRGGEPAFGSQRGGDIRSSHGDDAAGKDRVVGADIEADRKRRAMIIEHHVAIAHGRHGQADDGNSPNQDRWKNARPTAHGAI